VAHGNLARPATPACDRSLIDSEDYRISLLQRDYVGVLAARCGLRHDEFATGEIDSRLGEQDGDL
jgi:hypothetical protein